MSYASTTSVTPERSRAEIEKTLKRYGADEFGYAYRQDRAGIQFTMNDRTVRMTILMPDPAERTVTHTPTGNRRTAAQQKPVYEQAVRQRWRALTLVVKAKLEAVASGIVTFEQEFLPHIVLPGGQTVYEATAPAIAEQYESGAPGPLLQIGGTGG